MKTLIHVMLAIGALTSPTLSSAQVITVPLTRAHVYADYPADIQAAERRVVEQNGTAQGDTGYGPSVNGTSQQNRRSDMTVSTYSPPIYAHH